MYVELSEGMDRVTTVIWRPRNKAPEEAATSSVGEQVEATLHAAERNAAEIRRDAEIWAQQHMEETRRRADALAMRRIHELSAIIDDLLARTQIVARASEELVETLEVRAGRPGVSDGARLLATKMAIAGTDREKIRSRLRNEFGIEDPTAIRDETGF
jgi:hypothetical protein